MVIGSMTALCHQLSVCCMCRGSTQYGDMDSVTSDVNKATTFKAKVKATYLKAKNTTTFPQHLYRTIHVLRSNLQSSVFTQNQSVFHQYRHKTYM